MYNTEYCVFQLGVTPLHLAAEKDFVDCIRMLVIQYHANVDSRNMVSGT